MTRQFYNSRKGLAAVEFAFIAPILAMMLGGIADFGLLINGQSQLANGVAQGVQYALFKGPSLTVATLKTVVSAGAGNAGLSPSVSVSVTGPACYCTSSTPVSLVTPSTAMTGTYTCSGTCTGGVTPGIYLTINATFSYVPLMPYYSTLATTTVTETTTVRLL